MLARADAFLVSMGHTLVDSEEKADMYRLLV